MPHGNVNKENETRWTMNCRFKSVFTPYKDKKIGEFYEPITLKPATKRGLNYKFQMKNKKLKGYIFSRSFMGSVFHNTFKILF